MKNGKMFDTVGYLVTAGVAAMSLWGARWVRRRLAAAESATRDALASQHAAEREASALRRELREALDAVRNIERTELRILTSGHENYLRHQAARADQLAHVVALHRTALERIADGHKWPQQVAIEALATERAGRRRASCAKN